MGLVFSSALTSFFIVITVINLVYFLYFLPSFFSVSINFFFLFLSPRISFSTSLHLPLTLFPFSHATLPPPPAFFPTSPPPLTLIPFSHPTLPPSSLSLPPTSFLSSPPPLPPTSFSSFHPLSLPPTSFLTRSSPPPPPPSFPTPPPPSKTILKASYLCFVLRVTCCFKRPPTCSQIIQVDTKLPASVLLRKIAYNSRESQFRHELSATLYYWPRKRRT